MFVVYDIDTEFIEFTNKSITNGAVDALAAMVFNANVLDGPAPGTIVIGREAVPAVYVFAASCDATNVNDPNPNKFNAYVVAAPVPVDVIVAHGLVVPEILSTPVNAYVIATMVLVEVAAGASVIFK